jgi:hypothetical protein
MTTRAELPRVVRELGELRTLANATAMALDATRRECEANMRVLQAEVENLKKLLSLS